VLQPAAGGLQVWRHCLCVRGGSPTRQRMVLLFWVAALVWMEPVWKEPA
jgi:hypothetical protein